jgi:hypothetical protein
MCAMKHFWTGWMISIRRTCMISRQLDAVVHTEKKIRESLKKLAALHPFLHPKLPSAPLFAPRRRILMRSIAFYADAESITYDFSIRGERPNPPLSAIKF